MLSDQPGQHEYLKAILVEETGLSEKSPAHSVQLQLLVAEPAALACESESSPVDALLRPQWKHRPPYRVVRGDSCKEIGS
jgi:hypothetical protein